MFFGGSLGAHVAVDSDNQDETFVALRKLSRRCVLVVDSDRRKPGSQLKRHVRRWRDAAEGDPNLHLWVTEGREIENYLSPDTIDGYRRSIGVAILDEHRFGGVIEGIANPKKVQLAERTTATHPDVPTAGEAALERFAEFIRASSES